MSMFALSKEGSAIVRSNMPVSRYAALVFGTLVSSLWGLIERKSAPVHIKTQFYFY